MAKWTQIRWDEAMLEAAKRGLVGAGVIIEGQAVALAPIDTGRLKGSITYATQTQHSRVRSPAKAEDAVSVPEDEYTLHVGTNVEYAEFQEYGTSRLVTGQPFLRVSMDIMKKACEEYYSKMIQQELNRRVK